jgi:signal transduction histidine kinase
MVKAYAEMIRDLSGDNPAKRSEHVNIIIEESDRLAALVNDILDLSKLESGSEGLNLSKFSITKKIHEIMGRYTLLSEQQGYSFYVNAETDFETEADIIKIEQVLYNLINNAVNYTGENKNVYINLLIKDKDTARIEITDTGKGIEPDLLPLIFDRYYRAEKNKREVIGTGLGLSIVKQILKRHNFKFGVRSELGAGSTFWFEVKGRAVEEKGEKEKNGLSEN